MATISNKVRYYHSGMAGAPTLSGAAGTLIAVLDACLVNGFGSKALDSLTVTGGIATAQISSGHDYAEGDVIRLAGATPAKLNSDWRLASTTANSITFSVEGCGIPDGAASGTMTALRAPAGWEKLFADGTTRAAYRSLNHADHNGLVLYVDDTGTTTARARGYESMSDIDSGVGPFPTDAQLSGGYWWAKAHSTTGARPWRLVADDRRLTFAPHYATSYSRSAPSLCFGRLLGVPGDAWATLITGATTSSSAVSTQVAAGGDAGLLVYDSSGGLAAYLARGLDDTSSKACSAVILTRSGVGTGDSNYYSTGDLTSTLFALEALVCEGTTGTILPRGFAAGPMALCRGLNVNSYPVGQVVGVHGDGGVFIWGNYNSRCWILNIGRGGKWE